MWPFKKKEPLTDEQINRVAARIQGNLNLKQYRNPAETPVKAGIAPGYPPQTDITSLAEQLEQIQKVARMLGMVSPEELDYEDDEIPQEGGGDLAAIMDFLGKQGQQSQQGDSNNVLPVQATKEETQLPKQYEGIANQLTEKVIDGMSKKDKLMLGAAIKTGAVSKEHVNALTRKVGANLYEHFKGREQQRTDDEEES